jgi:septal ring factor EnvC (AmiA/AmiB activator)
MNRRRLIFPVAFAVLATGVVAVAATEERLARLNVEETHLSAEQAHNMNQLSRLLSVLQQLRRDPPPALLVSPRDAKDAVRAAILVKAMTPELERRAIAYSRQANEMMKLRRLAAVESEALFTTESKRADASPVPAQAPILRGPTAPSAPDAAITPPQSLTTPIAGPVVRRFGDALSSGGRANGVTFAAARGAQVASPGPAVVQYVGPVKGWGVILILRLAGGYHLVLAGLDRTSVTVGQSVAAGQSVGSMPDGRQSGGRSPSAELYLEVREQGVPVDPGRWLKTKAG